MWWPMTLCKKHEFADRQQKHQMTVTIDGSSLEEVLASADFITLHVPGVSTNSWRK